MDLWHGTHGTECSYATRKQLFLPSCLHWGKQYYHCAKPSQESNIYNIQTQGAIIVYRLCTHMELWKLTNTVRGDLPVMKFTCYAISQSPNSNMWVHIEVNIINNPWDSNALSNVFLTGLVSSQMFRKLILICWCTLIQKLLYPSWKIVITSDGCGLVGV